VVASSAVQSASVVAFAIGVSDGDAVAEPAFSSVWDGDRIAVCPWGLPAASICQMVCHEYETSWSIYNPAFGPDVVEEVPPRMTIQQPAAQLQDTKGRR